MLGWQRKALISEEGETLSTSRTSHPRNQDVKSEPGPFGVHVTLPPHGVWTALPSPAWGTSRPCASMATRRHPPVPVRRRGPVARICHAHGRYPSNGTGAQQGCRRRGGRGLPREQTGQGLRSLGVRFVFSPDKDTHCLNCVASCY